MWKLKTKLNVIAQEMNLKGWKLRIGPQIHQINDCYKTILMMYDSVTLFDNNVK